MAYYSYWARVYSKRMILFPSMAQLPSTCGPNRPLVSINLLPLQAELFRTQEKLGSLTLKTVATKIQVNLGVSLVLPSFNGFDIIRRK